MRQRQPSIATHSTGPWTRRQASWRQRAHRRKTARTRYVELFVHVAKDWRQRFRDGDAAHAQGGPAQRHHFSPTPGNAFQVFSNLVRSGFGGTQGNGRQYVSGFTKQICARCRFLIDHEELAGPVNIAAPNPLPNREFMAALRDAWRCPTGSRAGSADRDWRILSAH